MPFGQLGSGPMTQRSGSGFATTQVRVTPTRRRRKRRSSGAQSAPESDPASPSPANRHSHWRAVRSADDRGRRPAPHQRWPQADRRCRLLPLPCCRLLPGDLGRYAAAHQPVRGPDRWLTRAIRTAHGRVGVMTRISSEASISSRTPKGSSLALAAATPAATKSLALIPRTLPCRSSMLSSVQKRSAARAPGRNVRTRTAWTDAGRG